MVKVYRVLPNETNKMDEINSFIQQKKPIINAVYMPECGHCHAMIPKWNGASSKIAKKYNGDVIIALIHKDSMSDLNMPSGHILGYPHIMSYINNRENEYNGDRSEEDFIKFMIQNGGSYLKPKQNGGKKHSKSRKTQKSRKVKRTIRKRKASKKTRKVRRKRA